MLLRLALLYHIFNLRASIASQIPLVQIKRDRTWDLTFPPSENSTHHLVFDTVNSLLQSWPNTRYRNGHNLVPGTVPPGTLLYHGRSTNEVPNVPEWTATDPEHSYMFCRGRGEGEGCWHLTLVTNRALNVLYFDGSSAAKMPYGSMDTQDIVAWGEVKPDWSFNERKRITSLCDWGKKFGIDGFVRMEMDFEVMLCEFTVDSGVDVLSFLNLQKEMDGRAPPGDMPSKGSTESSQAHPCLHEDHYLPASPGRSPKSMMPERRPPPPPHGNNHSLVHNPVPFQAVPGRSGESGNSVVFAGHWHNRYPGDTRIHLDLTRIISFYDIDRFPSLVDTRYGVERWFHRLENISESDASLAMKMLEATSDPTKLALPGSGIDWKTLFNVVADRFADRLELLDYTMSNLTSLNSSMVLNLAQGQLGTMLRPYLLQSAQLPDSVENMVWAEPIYKLCATSHTSFIASPSMDSKLTKSERLLLGAVNGVSKEICRTLTTMWASQATSDPAEVRLDAWRNHIKGLMKWLDWSVWIKCRPLCSFEEECYLPTWPFFGGPGGHGPGPGGPDGPRGPGGPRRGPPEGSPPFVFEDDDNWKKPQPTCIKRVTYVI